MKKDDIFEALTDIDDKFIAAAHPTEFGDGQPVVVHPAPGRSVWKTLVSAAACLAVLCTAGVFGARYIMERAATVTPENTVTSGGGVLDQNGGGNTSLLTAEAPGFEEVRVYPTGAKNEFTMEEFPGSTFTVTYRGILFNGQNTDAVDVPLIIADYIDNLFLCDLNGDGKRELCATVQNGGVQSVEILDFASGDRYISDRKNTSAYLQADYVADVKTLKMYERSGGGDCLLVGSGSPSLAHMTHIFADTAETVPIVNRPEEFVMAELPGTFFVFENSAVFMCGSTEDTMLKKLMNAENVYLADLNGDGRRELCGQIAKRSDDLLVIQVTVCDIANGETYIKAFTFTEFKWPVARVVEVVDGKLMLIKYDEQNETKVDRSPLTLDALEKQAKPDYEEVPLDIHQTFTFPDFEGFTFAVYTNTAHPTFDFGWDNNSKGVGNNADRVLLCDLDGDGRREIIVYNEYTDLGCLRIYGFMDDGEVGSVYYYEKGGYRFAEDGSKLLIETSESEPFVFSKSDLIPNFAQSYTEILSWDHTMDFTEIFPWSYKYGFSIENGRFQITGGGETVFDSGVELEELYYISDEENDCLYFAYKVKYNGAVGLLELTANSADSFYLEDGASLKPTNDTLFVETEYGSKTFVLPKQFRDIVG